jgi:transcriptional regulator with XRE-family HTH domain
MTRNRRFDTSFDSARPGSGLPTGDDPRGRQRDMTTPPTDPRPHGDAAYPQRFAGERLRQRRHELDLTRAAVAAGARLSRAAVKAMEHNRIRPSDEAFARLCNVLGLTAASGRERLMVPGPPDNRPTEYASEATAADKSPRRRDGRRLAALVRRSRR